MNNEDFERQMEFILEQQAKFEEFFVKQKDYNTEVNARLDRTDRQLAELVGFTGVLRDALVGLTHHAERHDREMADLVERGRETDARLNALILIVERHVSDHQ
jgi:hypothetical protein